MISAMQAQTVPLQPSLSTPAGAAGSISPQMQSLIHEQQQFSSQIEALIAGAGCPSTLQSHTQWALNRPIFSDRLLHSTNNNLPSFSSNGVLGTPLATSFSSLIPSFSATAPSAAANDQLAKVINSTISHEITLSQDGNLELGGNPIEFVTPSPTIHKDGHPQVFLSLIHI